MGVTYYISVAFSLSLLFKGRVGEGLRKDKVTIIAKYYLYLCHFFCI